MISSAVWRCLASSGLRAGGDVLKDGAHGALAGAQIVEAESAQGFLEGNEGCFLCALLYFMSVGGQVDGVGAAVVGVGAPLDRIVLETDAPYLAPTPHRGQRNEPAYLPLVIERLAQIYDVTPDEVAARTALTAERLFLN